EGSGTRPTFSFDGKYVAYFESSPTSVVRLAVIPFTGGAAVKTFEVANTVYPSAMGWAPDGKSLIYKEGFMGGVWQQPLDGTKPKLLPGFEDKEIYQFAWSPDGKNLAYSTGQRMQEIILIENSR
ncbi:MAG TPA: hypothetical protein VKD91_17685, partial [Pyrinomonadaceae bacterium]|nr:hypothetical protein [Pyrinomonadaceae bacterium]